MKELPPPPNALSLAELNVALVLRIPSSRQIAVASDFDETLCSNYTYDPILKNHIPGILPELRARLIAMKSPLIITTSRSPREVTVQHDIASLVASKGTPLVCENGAVLFQPGQKQEIVPLISPQQMREVEDLLAVVSTMDWNEIIPEKEVIVSKDRIATFEIRVQEYETGVGDSTHYERLTEMLKATGLNTLDFSSSGNSLSIQPKGISKATGLDAALTRMGFTSTIPFIVGMGDGFNDRELFARSDLSIAVNSRVGAFADLSSNDGDRAALAVLQRVQ